MAIMVTGATGYVGRRLVPRLISRGFKVRVLVSDAAKLRAMPWRDGVEVRTVDLLDRRSLDGAFDDISQAYYLVHSMWSGPDFADCDRQASKHFSDAAAGSSVSHVIYLGGLQPPSGKRVTSHLNSRAEVGRILRERLPVTELQAGPIIGSGSASFEIVRYLTERLPVMISPKWVMNPVHPIGVDDMLAYLVAAADISPSGIIPVGADCLTFKAMMETYARLRGLRRMILRVPVLAPKLAGQWVGLVTPIPNRLAVPVIEGMIHELRIDTTKANALFPAIRPMTYDQAVAAVLDDKDEYAFHDPSGEAVEAVGDYCKRSDCEGVLFEVHATDVRASPQRVYDVFSSLGGSRGWLSWNWAWRFRGLLDRLIGGPGLRRVRPDRQSLRTGDQIDWWRIESLEQGHRLRLRAEMRLPGTGRLEWRVVPRSENRSRLIQIAEFKPLGLTGVLYWYALYPMHRPIFRSLLNAIAREAER